MPDPIVLSVLAGLRDELAYLRRTSRPAEELADAIQAAMDYAREDLALSHEQREEVLSEIFVTLAPCPRCDDEGYIVGEVDVWDSRGHTTRTAAERCDCWRACDPPWR